LRQKALKMKKKDTFSTIRFKIKIANRFRKFSMKIAKTHSEALKSILDFFEVNGISPNEKIGANMNTLENRLKKRINALIAIVKDIEKNEIKPTNAMIQALFQENPMDNVSDEVYKFEAPELITENEELNYYRDGYYKNQENYNKLQQEIVLIIEKARYVKSNFSTGYLRLDISKEELEQLKQKLKRCTSL